MPSLSSATSGKFMDSFLKCNLTVTSDKAPEYRCPRCYLHFCSFEHAHEHKGVRSCTDTRDLGLYIGEKLNSSQQYSNRFGERDINFVTVHLRPQPSWWFFHGESSNFILTVDFHVY